MRTKAEYRYPPSHLLDVAPDRRSTTALLIAAVFAAALVDLTVFVTGPTVVPYNYPFYFDVALLCLVAVLLQLSHAVLWDMADELVTIIEYNRDDPLSLSRDLEPEAVWTELENVLFLAYHPAVVAVGGIVGGLLVTSIMYALGVFDAYPYLVMNFGFGAAHGVFFGPVAGMLYVAWRSYTAYIVDINLLDPDGVGGYRQIGNGIVKLATYGISIITVDFVILSSVGFTRYTQFQIVVSVLYFLLLSGFIVGTLGVTVLFRKRLLAIRDEKVDIMQRLFIPVENGFWRKALDGENNFSEAMHIISMFAMFHQMDKMNMWPINVYSLFRLTVSIGFSLTVYYVQLATRVQDFLTLL